MDNSNKILSENKATSLTTLKIKNPLITCVSEGLKYLGRDLNPYILTDTGF